MSGHNKWSKIKHKKAASDAKKGKEFGKLARLIAVESKRVGGDANAPSLRVLTEKARSINMPKDNIERAIEKGRSTQGELLDNVVYEAYGPGGVALLIEGVTDSKNRTSAEIKHLLSKHGATLATPGSAMWAFTKVNGEFEAVSPVAISNDDEEKLLRLLEELDDHDDVHAIATTAAFSEEN